MSVAHSADKLFTPLQVGSMRLPNRIVMAPMTRAYSPNGVPGADVAAYYRRRAEHGTGLIISEGTWIPELHASNDSNVPRFYGEDALAGWRHVLAEVKASGGLMIPQLWHVGITPKTEIAELYRTEEAVTEQVGPSGIMSETERSGKILTHAEIEQVAQAYVDAARTAFDMGFDGVELHGAHGYLIDQFFWHITNRRGAPYGGDIAERTRFAADIVREIRRQTAPDFPIVLRYSQWKIVDFAARLAEDPVELERFLAPLVDAGVDVFHVSQRRFWEPAFDDSDLSLAGWTKKLSGKTVITVGSVTLDKDMFDSMVVGKATAGIASLDALLERFDRGEFDLVAVGRAMISNPDWARIVQSGDVQSLSKFDVGQLTSLA